MTTFSVRHHPIQLPNLELYEIISPSNFYRFSKLISIGRIVAIMPPFINVAKSKLKKHIIRR